MRLEMRMRTSVLVLVCSFLGGMNAAFCVAEEPGQSGMSIEETIQGILQKDVKNGSAERDADMLGLLATGEKAYLAAVGEYARGRAKTCESLDVIGNRAFGTAEAGILNILLCEYYLISKDEQVLPGIKALSTYLSFGISGIGTWGKEMADVESNGLYGPSKGDYGTTSNLGLPCAISLVLARKCGVSSKPIEKAVELSKGYFRYFVGKGSIPNHDLGPNPKPNPDNRSHMGAVYYRLLGDKEAAAYFTRMTLVAEGNEGIFKLSASAAATRLMQQGQAVQALYITGKGGSNLALLSKAEVEESIAAGKLNMRELRDDALLATLGSFARNVRERAAGEIAKRGLNVGPQLVKMLSDRNPYARYGACTAIHYLGYDADEALDAMIDIINNSSDHSLLHFAIDALTKYSKKGGKWPGFGNKVVKSAPALVDLAIRSLPGDPYGKISAQTVRTLFYSGHGAKVEGHYVGMIVSEVLGVEKTAALAKAWLNNPSGEARCAGLGLCRTLYGDDLDPLWESIYFTTRDWAPGGTMFGWAQKSTGIKLMAMKRVQEGLELGWDYFEETGGSATAVAALSFYRSNLGDDGKKKLEAAITLIGEKEGKGSHEYKHGAMFWEPNLQLASVTGRDVLWSLKPLLTKEGLEKNKRLYPGDFE